MSSKRLRYVAFIFKLKCAGVLILSHTTPTPTPCFPSPYFPLLHKKELNPTMSERRKGEKEKIEQEMGRNNKIRERVWGERHGENVGHRCTTWT